jgi:hypothetical protein
MKKKKTQNLRKSTLRIPKEAEFQKKSNTFTKQNIISLALNKRYKKEAKISIPETLEAPVCIGTTQH